MLATEVIPEAATDGREPIAFSGIAELTASSSRIRRPPATGALGELVRSGRERGLWGRTIRELFIRTALRLRRHLYLQRNAVTLFERRVCMFANTLPASLMDLRTTI